MKDTPKAGRFVFALPDGSLVRVQPHDNDDTKAVIKAADGNTLDNFAMYGGVDLKADPVITGSSYMILVVDKVALASAVANIISGFISTASTMKLTGDDVSIS